jgi:uncharacterized protein YjbI with pentapeptide repeats
MASSKQLARLRKGAQVWNKWRANNPDLRVDLHQASLAFANLSGVNLTGADLSQAELHEVTLVNSDLRDANLENSRLRHTNLTNAYLTRARLYGAILDGAELTDGDMREARLETASFRRANLSNVNFMLADLSWADLREANLSGANLSGADLYEADLRGANLSEANFRKSRFIATIFENSLSKAVDLEIAIHSGPSTIGRETFALSKGKIPGAFLRACGLSDWEVEMVKLYNPELSNEERNQILYKMYDIQGSQAIQISPLFLSYSHADDAYVDKLESKLNEKGIRFWRDVHHATAGPLEKQIDRAIRQNPTVLLVLSQHSLNSDWVEHEVKQARQTEKEMGRDVLCPVTLDDSWKKSTWPARVMEQIMEYNILDFSEWEDNSKFDEMFRKLIDGLELFYKG